MKMNKIIEKLSQKNNYKIKQIQLQNLEDYNNFIQSYRIPKDYAYFIKYYEYLQVSFANFKLEFGGIPFLLGDLSFEIFQGLFRVSSLTISYNKLLITIFFDLKINDNKGIYYNIYIEDKNLCICLESKSYYFQPNFMTFLFNIPNLITHENLQKLISYANIDFDIEKAIEEDKILSS